MAQLVVRNIDSSVKARLKRRAERHGRSMEEEARRILRDAVSSETPSRGGLGSRIARHFMRAGFEDEILELRGHPARPARFDK